MLVNQQDTLWKLVLPLASLPLFAVVAEGGDDMSWISRHRYDEPLDSLRDGPDAPSPGFTMRITRDGAFDDIEFNTVQQD